MNLSVLSLIKLGIEYMKLWPEKAELSHYFSEYQVIQFSRTVYKLAPALAVFTLVLQITMNTDNGVMMGIFYALFILSLPIQAMVILGVKADKHLPPSLASWYREGVARFNEQGGNIKLSVHKPRYIDLAKLLNITYKKSFE